MKFVDAILAVAVAVFATPQLVFSSLLFEKDRLAAIQNASTLVWSAVAYLALIMTALGYGIWYHLLGKYSVNQVMPFLLLLPLPRHACARTKNAECRRHSVKTIKFAAS